MSASPLTGLSRGAFSLYADNFPNSDWQHLQKAAEAADAAIFIVSTEATATGHPLREYVWPAPVNGYRAALHVDPRITEDFKTALDTMTCIVSSAFQNLPSCGQC